MLYGNCVLSVSGRIDFHTADSSDIQSCMKKEEDSLLHSFLETWGRFLRKPSYGGGEGGKNAAACA